MKKFFLIVFIFRFSLFGFCQSEGKHHYTDQEVTKLTGYITDLEKKIVTGKVASGLPVDKKQITTLLTDSSHNYSDDDVIRIFKYIKDLEKIESVSNSVVVTAAVKKNDTLIETKEMTYLLVKGKVNFEDSLSGKKYSDIIITVTDKLSSQLVGIYTPNSKTGKYIFILNSGIKYVVEAEAIGYRMYSEDFSPEFKPESYEMTQEITLKKENK